eukprot:1155746-Pelagomonas_calceolata.AAC.8
MKFDPPAARQKAVADAMHKAVPKRGGEGTTGGQEGMAGSRNSTARAAAGPDAAAGSHPHPRHPHPHQQRAADRRLGGQGGAAQARPAWAQIPQNAGGEDAAPSSDADAQELAAQLNAQPQQQLLPQSSPVSPRRSAISSPRCGDVLLTMFAGQKGTLSVWLE